MKPKLGSLFLRGKTWWIKFGYKGLLYRESTKARDRGEAEKYLARRAGEIATGKFHGMGPERITVGALLENLIETYKLEGRKSLYETELRIRKNLKSLWTVRAAEFGTRQIKEYIRKRSRKAQPATINRELAAIRRAFTLGMESDPPMIYREPTIKALREDNVRTGFLEHGQYVALRNALPEELKMLLVAGYHIGWRKSELTYLRWEQVDMEAKEVRLVRGRTKNNDGRVAPIYGEFLEWMLLAKEIRDRKYPKCAFVFHRNGARIRDFRCAWETACKAAGVPDLLVHDLRRCAVRNLERAGVPRSVAMRITGHKTESIYRRYDIVSASDMRLAAEKMTAHIKEMGVLAQNEDTKAEVSRKENTGKSVTM